MTVAILIAASWRQTVSELRVHDVVTVVRSYESMPRGGEVGCRNPRAELPTEVTVEAPEERLVSATDVPQRPRGRG